MRILCPNCAAEYEVPASLMKPQRTVRCTRCGGKWMAAPEIPDGSREEPPPPSHDTGDLPADGQPERPITAASLPPVTAMDRLAANVPRPHRRAGLTAAWITTLVILAAAVAAMIAWREPIIRAWPPIGRILGSVDHGTLPPAPDPGKVAEPPRHPKE